MNFNNFSKNYNKILDRNVRLFGELSDYFAEYKVKLLNSFYLKNKINKSIKLLDLGCSIGKIERYLLSYFPQSKVYGIDPSAEAIKLVSSINKNWVFSVYDGKNIPFENNFFDAILISCTLHHVLPAERKGILEESYRVLNKNGFLFTFEHNPFNPLTRYVVKTCIFDTDACLLSKKACVGLLENSNFSIVETGYIVFFPKFLKWLRMWEKELRPFPLGAQYFITAQKR